MKVVIQAGLFAPRKLQSLREKILVSTASQKAKSGLSCQNFSLVLVTVLFAFTFSLDSVLVRVNFDVQKQESTSSSIQY